MMKRNDIFRVSNKMQAAVWHLAALMLLFVIVASCDREPLELFKKGDSKVSISYDWSEYKGSTPNGIFVMYFHNGDSLTNSYATHDLNGEEHDHMANGTYKQMVMTNTFQEYLGNMRFFYTDNYEKMMAISNTYNITDMNAWDYGRQYMVEPMPIGLAIDSFEVKLDNDGLVFYEYDKDGGADTLYQVRQDTIRPMTTTLTIRVKVRGLNYLKDPSQGGIDGFISGLADGFYFGQQWRRSETGDIKLDHWRIESYEPSSSPNRTRRAGERVDGWIAIDVETFGLPHGRELLYQRTEKSNFMKLHFTMIDNKTVDFNYDVGKMIHYDGDDGSLDVTFEQNNVSLQLDLAIDAPIVDEDELPTIPYAQPTGTGAFDAEVEPWGDEVNVDIPM